MKPKLIAKQAGNGKLAVNTPAPATNNFWRVRSVP